MFLTLLFVGGFSAGLIKFQVETDPVALWSAAARAGLDAAAHGCPGTAGLTSAPPYPCKRMP